MVEMCLVEVIAAGRRLEFEFEQLLPGGEDPEASDPILDAIELRDHGYPDRVPRATGGPDRVGPALHRRARAPGRPRVRAGRAHGGAGALRDQLCWALLWLNPADNQGARALLPDIAAGAPWPERR